MLQQMRTGAKSTVVKFFLFGLLLLAMAGLAIMDVQGMFQGGLGNKTVVARMDGEKITTTEFDRLFQQELRSQNMTIEQAYRAGFPKMVLQQEINRRVMSRATRDLGLLVDDRAAAVEIKKLIQPLVQQQGMTEEQALQYVLRNVGIGERQLVATVKDQIARENLLMAITGGTNVPDQMVNDALKYRYEQRRGEYITLSPADIDAVPEPKEEELKDFYGQISAAFMVPERRSFSVILLDHNALGIKMPTDAEIKAYYDANQKEFMAGDTRDIAQVVTKDAELAKKIHADVVASKDLKKAAGKLNIIRGTYAEADLPAEIASHAFKAKAGEVTELVESPLGFHIVYIEKINTSAPRPFASVKEEIAEKLSADSALYDKANEIDDKVAGGTPLSDIAKQYGISETVFTDVEAGKRPATDIPMFDKVLQSAFALDKGEASQLIETPKGFLLVEVRDVKKAAPKDFEEVRAEITQAWKKARQTEAYQSKAAKIIERINLGESFDKVADSLGKRIERTDLIARGDTVSGQPSPVTQALFSIDKIGQAIPVQEEGGLKILRLAERKTDMPAKTDPKDVQTLRYILGQALQNDILEQYRRDLMGRYDVEINDALLEKMYAPKDESDASE